MRYLPVALALFISAGCHAPAQPGNAWASAQAQREQPEQADEDEANSETMISRAVFAGGRLWLLTDDGSLTSLAQGENKRRQEQAGAKVLELCVSGGQLTALTRAGDGQPFTLRARQDGGWQAVGVATRRGETFKALSCGEEGILLLTNQRLIDVAADRSVRVRFPDEDGPPHITTAMVATPEAVFLGLNAGEWGGGMQRIDRRTGRIKRVERNATGELCDGPLNSNCDPVQAIQPMPSQPGCLAAAVGLIHFVPRGRIVRICPGSIEQLYAVADPDIAPPRNPSACDAECGRYGSVAFFGLAALGDELIALGHNGLYRLAEGREPVHQPLPRFEKVDGVFVSFELEDVILVMTEVNRRASISGLSPLLVLR